MYYYHNDSQNHLIIYFYSQHDEFDDEQLLLLPDIYLLFDYLYSPCPPLSGLKYIHFSIIFRFTSV